MDITAVLVALIGTITGALAFIQSRANQKALASQENRKVDAEAFSRARDIYEGSLKELEARLKRLSEQMAAMDVRNALIEREVLALRLYIRLLRKQMMDAGMQPPPEPVVD